MLLLFSGEAPGSVVDTNSENWWAAGRVVSPATGYDERMDHAVGDAVAAR
ncbi:hypothetical protein [Saccharopolyspora elongata]|nr:hypothetical protein [Saccharopolyspora elongata]